ncbi:hydantoinase B/oxoprolinase family protein [Albimonas sp. CAU 1670]|uniref:hydantoinase B/oxoprolinase family protein n=1 Tax=Albimonas sp. CAU 1670 TaxID=3032599 RepID=UPI0023DC1E9F|nr:hydantoinase B/oxoprolinase family protein [Albimonas sp. CAU 1670]MDF2235157.1 hydantoinase B/oxoprolinase family protein [Albimonas sp. CAU 1670]
MTSKASTIDPISASVIQGALQSIAVEMGYKLMRMSYSSIIRESEDFGAALTDASGRQIAESMQSTPLQSGPIAGYVQNVLKTLEARGDRVNPGDVILHNDPYGGASHGPDFAFLVPVFRQEKLVGFAATTAHHLDVGAQTPGSAGIVEAIDVYAEGLQFKAIKVRDRGVDNAAVWQILRDNVRAPKLVVGDMEAQIAACEIGAERYGALIDEHGLDRVEAAVDALMDHSEAMMRQAIAALPDGVYKAETKLDGFLDDPERRHFTLAVTLTVKGDEIHVDLTGTSPQCDDRPINLPYIGTTDIAIWLTLRSVLLDSAVHGIIPQNSGLTRPITIHAPLGCIANPRFPAPVIARFTGGNGLADCVMKALSLCAPEQVSAGIGNLKCVAFSGLNESEHWVHMEIFEGAYGGRFGMDGMDAVDTLYANTRNNPIEDIETHLPLRVTRYELNEGVTGPGKWRGGFGSVRAFEFLAPGGISVEGEGHAFRPWGFEGGEQGGVASLTSIAPDASTASLPSKVPYRATRAGETFLAVGPAGGGYGKPFERDPAKVLADVLDELLTPEQARADYGVVIAAGAVDVAATEAMRKGAN